ncbi:alpha/beta hydrolase-fold protein, partial [Gordonia alkanivorans]
TGSTMANPICVDSKLGNVATYLSQDVPDWVAANLKLANTDSRSWAVGGLSYGGTCALQLATNYPDVYPTFLDLSGQIEPSLGSRQQTIDTAFDGDEAAFKAVNPMDLMVTRQYPDTAGAFVVGRDDAMYRAGLKEVFEAARRAGMDVHFSEVPGGHSFAVWSVGLRQEMPWLGKRLGIPE